MGNIFNCEVSQNPDYAIRQHVGKVIAVSVQKLMPQCYGCREEHHQVIGNIEEDLI